MTKKDITQITAAVVEALSKNTPLYQKEILTLDEAAQYTGMTSSAIYKLTSTRKIPFSKPNGKNCFFRRVELEAWLMSNPVATVDELNSRVVEYCMRKPIGHVKSSTKK